MTDPIPFSGNFLDRASYRRTDEAWLAAQLATGLFLPFWQNRPFVVRDRAGFLPWREEWRGQTSVFLGLDGAQPLFAIDLAEGSEPVLGEGTFAEMRASAAWLPARDTAIAGQAKALLDWHKRHGFCPNCAAPTQLRDGGYRRLCSQCGAEHFPRTDPVVIMLPYSKTPAWWGATSAFRRSFISPCRFCRAGRGMEEAVRRIAPGQSGGRHSRYHAHPALAVSLILMLGCMLRQLTRLPDRRARNQGMRAGS